uniref:Uncharacterized protein n=1 Tax=Leptobrachium leishanense TaxID=445787 RepID=A0A8C5QWW8_9ANUR
WAGKHHLASCCIVHPPVSASSGGYSLTQVFRGHMSDNSNSARYPHDSGTPDPHQHAPLPQRTFPRCPFPVSGSLFSQRVRESERAFTYIAAGCGSQFGTLLMRGVGSLEISLEKRSSGYMRPLRMAAGHAPLEKCFSVLLQSHVTWKSLLRKMPVWAVIVAQISVASTAFTLFSWLPTFFKEMFPDGKGWVFNIIPWLFAIPVAVFISGNLLQDPTQNFWIVLAETLLDYPCLHHIIYGPNYFPPLFISNWNTGLFLGIFYTCTYICTFFHIIAFALLMHLCVFPECTKTAIVV